MADKEKKVKLTKQQTLHKLAAIRIPRALTMIKNIGNLANYEPTDVQRKHITETIQNAVSRMVSRLNAPAATSDKPEYNLPK